MSIDCIEIRTLLNFVLFNRHFFFKIIIHWL